MVLSNHVSMDEATSGLNFFTNTFFIQRSFKKNKRKRTELLAAKMSGLVNTLFPAHLALLAKLQVACISTAKNSGESFLT